MKSDSFSIQVKSFTEILNEPSIASNEKMEILNNKTISVCAKSKEDLFNSLICLIELAEMIEKRTEFRWDQKYNLIFSPNISCNIFEVLKNIQFELEYVDPDTSYEEDVLAFVEALRAFKIANFVNIN